MATSGLYGNSSESIGLYGNTNVFGGTYFQWFIFQQNNDQPVTPTGGTWDFTTNTGTPPTGWTTVVASVAVNPVWFSTGFVDSRNPTVIVWSVPSLLTSSNSIYATAYSQTFTGNGTQTAFTLTSSPVTVNNTDVSINGVVQVPGVDYTVNSVTLTTTTPVINGAVMLVKYKQSLPNSYYGAASNVQFTPVGALTSTNVQSAIAEVVTDLALSSGSSTVGYLPAGTNAVATTVQTKLRESVSVKDFGATGNGSTDDTAAIQAAITYIYSFANASGTGTAPALYFPAGTYLMSSTITMGNTGYQYTLSPYFYGDGGSSIIKVTATNVNPFYWRGPNLGQPGAGNQCSGPTIENMNFVGPGSGTATSSSIALNFNTVQGTRLIGTSCSGWYVGENYVDHDVITRINASCDFNIIGINSSSLNNLIRLDRMQNNGGSITHNTTYGIFYMGGQTPSFNDVFFNSNGTSLLLSRQLASENVYPTVGPVIQGCYFEADTSYTMQFGAGSGIVRDMCILGGAVAGNSSVPLIKVWNYTDTTGRGFINMNLNNNGAGGIIDQSTSSGKIAYQTLDNVAIGSVIPSTGVFTKVNSGTFIKGAASGASVDLLSIGSYGSIASLSMTITATATGVVTCRKYQIVIMGNGTVTGSDVSFITEVYSGGGSAFSLVETAGSPTAGTNKLSISNTSGAGATYRVIYTVEDLTGTLTLL